MGKQPGGKKECFTPTPRSGTEDRDDDLAKSKLLRKNHRKTSGRRIIGGSDELPLIRTETPQGGNPLYWVRHGKEKLKSFSEVFVVFDKDGHPKMKEAFEEAATPDSNGKKVTVILNSRSFEYYMLLHFERIYRAFEKTECGEKDKKSHHSRYFHCGLPSAVVDKACAGDVCINGYARRNFVRNLALTANLGNPVYELNPYVDFQCILARLMEMRILRDGESVSKNCGRHEWQSIFRDKNVLVVENGSSALSLSLREGWIEYFHYPDDIVRFEDFGQGEPSSDEKEKAYSEIQFMCTSIRIEGAVSVSKESRQFVPLFRPEDSNVFAVLTFDGNRFLIFCID